jgi:hypothetical protein
MDGSETGSIKAGEAGTRSGLSAIETSDCAEAVDDLDCETGKDQNQVKRRNDKERHPGDRPYFCGHLIDKLVAEAFIEAGWTVFIRPCRTPFGCKEGSTNI